MCIGEDVVDVRHFPDAYLVFFLFSACQVVKRLPKTRSGKIMRRILRKVAMGEEESLGDISTLDDPSVVAEIVEAHQLTKNRAARV